MHHNVFLTIPSSSLFYFCLAKARSDVCTWLVYHSMHEARIITFHEANNSKTLNRNELSVPLVDLGFSVWQLRISFVPVRGFWTIIGCLVVPGWRS